MCLPLNCKTNKIKIKSGVGGFLETNWRLTRNSCSLCFFENINSPSLHLVVFVFARFLFVVCCNSQ